MAQNSTKKGDLNIAVIGSGASGIAAAHYLLDKGYAVDLIERADEIGGRIATAPLDDKMIAFGGKNIGIRAKLFRDFVSKNGDLAFEYFGSSWTREIDGKMVAFDNSNKLKLALNLLRYFSLADCIRFYKLFSSMKEETNHYLDGPYFRELSKKYDNRPISNYFSRSFCDNILRLITVRMNGVEPERYHLGNFCSNLGMMKVSKNMEQLRGDGMYKLLSNFSQRENLKVINNYTVEKLDIKNNKIVVSGLNCETDNTRSYDGVMLATQGSQSAVILKSINPEICDQLGKIVYNPVISVIVKYNREIFTREQRSITFDKDKVLSNAGCYGANDLNIVRYTFSGGEAQQELSEDTDPEELITIAEELLNKYFKVSKTDRVNYIYRYMPEGLCSYAPFHFKIMDRVNDLLSDYPIELTGDYVKGASIEACFKSSELAADKLVHKLNNRN